MRGRVDRTALVRVGVALALGALGALLALPVGGAANDGAATLSAKRAKPKSGVWKGRTSQGKRVRFRVKKGRVKRPSYSVRSRGCTAKVGFTTGSKVRKSGKFSFGSRSSHYFKGKFVSRRKVRGRAGIDFSKTSCPGRGVQSVRYGAHRKG